MKRILTVVALVALAACESATSSGREVESEQRAKAPGEASFSGGAGGAAHRPMIASVRKTGSNTYEASGMAVDGAGVYVSVYRSTSGFPTLTSGISVTANWSNTGETSVTWTAIAGNRYLVVVYPYIGGLVDPVHAVYMEAVP